MGTSQPTTASWIREDCPQRRGPPVGGTGLQSSETLLHCAQKHWRARASQRRGNVYSVCHGCCVSDSLYCLYMICPLAATTICLVGLSMKLLVVRVLSVGSL